MSSTAEIQALTDAIAKIGTSTFPVAIDLWDAKKIADYLNISKSRFSNYYATLATFPAPGRLPSDKGAGRPVWRAKDVIEWVNSNVFEADKSQIQRRHKRA
ncbi:MAG: helix-turn-helix transcriptional regulator [Candidatus Reddybacter sp.]